MKFIHVLAGLSALLAGAVALYALKGGRLHRRSGLVFVYAMLVMASTGTLMSIVHLNAGNVIAGVLTCYLVLTALITVRRPTPEFHRIDAIAMFAASTVVLGAAAMGVAALASADGKMQGIPPTVYFVFGFIALLATIGDVRVMRGWRTRGSFRIARHLWRMCFAMFIATASFFLGPSRRLPPFLRHSPLRPIPVLLVLLLMFYWLARVSIQARRRAAGSLAPG